MSGFDSLTAGDGEDVAKGATEQAKSIIDRVGRMINPFLDPVKDYGKRMFTQTPYWFQTRARRLGDLIQRNNFLYDYVVSFASFSAIPFLLFILWSSTSIALTTFIWAASWTIVNGALIAIGVAVLTPCLLFAVCAGFFTTMASMSIRLAARFGIYIYRSTLVMFRPPSYDVGDDVSKDDNGGDNENARSSSPKRRKTPSPPPENGSRY